MGVCAVKKAVSVIAVAVAVLLVAFLVYDGIANKETSADFFSMNTYVTAKFVGADSDECAEETRKLTEMLDAEMLSRTSPSSAVYKLNSNGGGRVDSKIKSYLEILSDVCQKSGGAFDFTLGAVSDLWNFGSEPTLPDENALKDALSHSGYENILIEDNSVSYSDKALVVDFGAAGKGIALDEIKEFICDKKVNEAVVSVGGSVLLYGGKEFTVGIRDPHGNSGSYIAKLNLTECCVSTSGSYEQQFEKDGEFYHHILNPETGYPADSGLLSVTVVSDSGILSDALSTACFVLGYEKGTELAKEFGAHAIFVTENKEIIAEDYLIDIIEITDDSYTLVTR